MSQPLSQMSQTAPYDPEHPQIKQLHDPVHGLLELSPLVVQVMDTPEFQRLRGLKQLGVTSFVYPSATHNRFSHSIGVSHLSRTWVRRLRNQAELDIRDRDEECVALAGLVHDLGHGPFSHVWDGEFLKRVRPAGAAPWCHEYGSEMLFDHLVEENNVDLDPEDARFVKNLIHGVRDGERVGLEKRFLFDIVANKRNGVDTDKFDYLSRDCYHLGIKTNFDCSRLLMMSRVIDDRVCFHQKDAFSLYELFHTRFSLHNRVYTHRVGKAIELMVVDCLVAADPYYKFSEAIHDPQRYSLLTDSILDDIARSTADELAPARAILRRINTRDLYHLTDQYALDRAAVQYVNSRSLNDIVEGIVASQDSRYGSTVLTADDVIVNLHKINYGMKDKDPVSEGCHFFSRWDATDAFRMPKRDVTTLLPAVFEEQSLRIFSRDRAKHFAVNAAFRKYARRHLPEERQEADAAATGAANLATTVRLSFDAEGALGRRAHTDAVTSDGDVGSDDDIFDPARPSPLPPQCAKRRRLQAHLPADGPTSVGDGVGRADGEQPNWRNAGSSGSDGIAAATKRFNRNFDLPSADSPNRRNMKRTLRRVGSKGELGDNVLEDWFASGAEHSS